MTRTTLTNPKSIGVNNTEMNKTELEQIVQMLRHMIDCSPHLTQTQKAICLNLLDKLEQTLNKEVFV